MDELRHGPRPSFPRLGQAAAFPRSQRTPLPLDADSSTTRPGALREGDQWRTIWINGTGVRPVTGGGARRDARAGTARRSHESSRSQTGWILPGTMEGSR